MNVIQRRLVANIRRQANARRILISHLPDRAGVGQTHFWAVMKGESSPTLGWMIEIARALDCDVADLVAKLKR